MFGPGRGGEKRNLRQVGRAGRVGPVGPGPDPVRTRSVSKSATKAPWGQVVFAPLMMSLIFSAGVCPFKTRRGRRLRRSWTAWTWASVTSVKLVPLGKYSRISPPVFSLVGR